MGDHGQARTFRAEMNHQRGNCSDLWALRKLLTVLPAHSSCHAVGASHCLHEQGRRSGLRQLSQLRTRIFRKLCDDLPKRQPQLAMPTNRLLALGQENECSLGVLVLGGHLCSLPKPPAVVAVLLAASAHTICKNDTCQRWLGAGQQC